MPYSHLSADLTVECLGGLLGAVCFQGSDTHLVMWQEEKYLSFLLWKFSAFLRVELISQPCCCYCYISEFNQFFNPVVIVWHHTIFLKKFFHNILVCCRIIFHLWKQIDSAYEFSCPFKQTIERSKMLLLYVYVN